MKLKFLKIYIDFEKWMIVVLISKVIIHYDLRIKADFNESHKYIYVVGSNEKLPYQPAATCPINFQRDGTRRFCGNIYYSLSPTGNQPHASHTWSPRDNGRRECYRILTVPYLDFTDQKTGIDDRWLAFQGCTCSTSAL